MMKTLFIDRDGTLLVEPPETFQVNSLEEMMFLPGVISALKKLSENGFKLVMVTNQDGLGGQKNPRRNYDLINKKMFEVFKGEGIIFSEIFECPHFEKDNCLCRKPKTGILGNFLIKNQIDLENSYAIGDRETDMEFAQNIGVKGYKLPENSWLAIAEEIINKPRTAKVSRKTKETEINISLNLDGNGKSTVNTGVKFFDHMLDQLGKHGGFDLDVSVSGDLEIDEHHTVEDTSLALGEAFKKALGAKLGIERYAYEKLLPMDESRAFVSLDFSGRGECLFKPKKFDREFVGDLPTEMVPHFFKSFCTASGLNGHFIIEGENTHHMIEILFKSFARCLRDAVKQTGEGVSSTKGVL